MIAFNLDSHFFLLSSALAFSSNFSSRARAEIEFWFSPKDQSNNMHWRSVNEVSLLVFLPQSILLHENTHSYLLSCVETRWMGSRVAICKPFESENPVVNLWQFDFYFSKKSMDGKRYFLSLIRPLALRRSPPLVRPFRNDEQAN